VFRREFASYFATPVAAVFLVVFLALSAGLTFLMSASSNAALLISPASSSGTPGSFSS